MKSVRTVAAAIAAGAMLTVAACGGGADTSADGGQGNQGDEQSSMSSEDMQESGSSESGVTSADDVYGPACDQVPSSGSGSVKGMIDDPVATAASNNPLLGKLTKAVQAADLTDTLNGADGITVFAPYDEAFKDLGKKKFEKLADNTDKLASILKYHVVGKQYDADGLAKAGKVGTLNDSAGSLKIDGSGHDVTVNGNKVLCGNIPTANATVFVIDNVMTPSEQ